MYMIYDMYRERERVSTNVSSFLSLYGLDFFMSFMSFMSHLRSRSLPIPPRRTLEAEGDETPGKTVTA